MKNLLWTLVMIGLLCSISAPAAPKKAAHATKTAETDQYKVDDSEKPYESLPRFRLGRIVDAGISLSPVSVAAGDKMVPLPEYNKKAYVIIRVLLDPKRSLSIHDFSVVYNNQAFNCIAIRPYQENFSADKRVFTPSDRGVTYDMLFLTDMPDFNPSGEVRVTLHYRLSGGGLTDIELKLKNYDTAPIQLAAPPVEDNSGAGNGAHTT